jgi:2-oxoglutarate ferredoxin oxidoreductase subunit gamma
MLSVICAGLGGQGVLTAGLVLANVCVAGNKKVTWVPSYGSEMRGGTASCRLRIADSEILNPFFDTADVLMAMSQASVDDIQAQVAEGGVIVVNSSMVDCAGLRKDVRVVRAPATELAAELKNPRGANLAMLGATIAATGLFPAEEFADGIDAYFEAKGKNNPLNRECFLKGSAAVSEG